MNFDPNDPRLTAYALGELDVAEQKEVEKLLQTSEEARAFVGEIRATADLVTAELLQEAAPALDPDRRESIETELVHQSPSSPSRRHRPWLGWGLGLAASIALVVGGWAALVEFGGGSEPPAVATSEKFEVAWNEKARIKAPAHLYEREEQFQRSGMALGVEDLGALRPEAPEQADSAFGVFKQVKDFCDDASKDLSVSIVNRDVLARQDGKEDLAGKSQPNSDLSLVVDSLGVPNTKPGDRLGELSRATLNRPNREMNQPAPVKGQTLFFDFEVADRRRGYLDYDTKHDARTLSDLDGDLGIVAGDLYASGYSSRNEHYFGVKGARAGNAGGSIDPYSDESNSESYAPIVENPFLWVPQNPLSTFSIDVDTGSYSNVRRILREGRRPPKGAVRIEEMINYFNYDYAPPAGPEPFAAHVEVAGCPWAPQHRLVRIGLKGKTFKTEAKPPSNLVFLIDVSGSMNDANKLPMLKESLRMLVQQISGEDQVAMVVYAGASGLVLPSTQGDNKQAILEAIDRLNSGGGTNGGEGIRLAYDVAVDNYIEGGVNRVILATDGDFNVGITNQSDLHDLIEEKAETGVFLTTLGFGTGDLQDSTLEQLADKGNGNYAYIDTLNEAKKVLVDELVGTLIAIAKDVKIQIEWNPTHVSGFRLIGYENRVLQHQDFNDDTKDAGEIGAGHTVTALYEIIPFGEEIDFPTADDLKYQTSARLTEAAVCEEIMTLKIRYKEPDGETSKLLEFPIADSGTAYTQAGADFKFATSVAAFGMILRDSEHKGSATLETVRELALEGIGNDPYGYRNEFLELVEKAKEISE